jgi:type I restriction enzyme S subunit
MSKIDDLIAELCPDGVEYKTLGDIATISRGGNLQKKDFREEGFPCIHYGQIYTKFGLFTDQAISFIDTEVAEKQKKAVPGDIIMAVTSENVEDVCKCVAWLGTSNVAVSGHTAIVHHNQDAKYLTYYFHSSHFFSQKVKLAHGTKVIEVTPDKLNGVKVPVPPLEVQREIVRVLDNFTFLSAELSAELQARKKQYEYYRNELLTFKTDIKKMCLSDVANVFRGEYITQKGTKTGDIPVILGGQEPAYYIDKANHEGEIIVIARSGASAGFVSYWNQPIFVTDGFGYEAKKEHAIPKYLYYALKNKETELNGMKRGAGVPHVSGELLGKVELPMPSIDVQKRVVQVLENFDAICNDLNIGLPAEMEARQKQYEYYRDALLTFAESGKIIPRQTDRA